MAARDQARWLPYAGAPRWGGRANFHPQRPRLDRPLPPDRPRRALAQDRIVPDRRRGGRLDGDGLPIFDKLRYRRDDRRVFLYAFDLIELDGEDLRREPIERRKAALAKLLRHAKAGLLLNEHIEYDDGEMVFHHACKLGLEGIVSKRLGSTYRSGRSRHWIKSKNPKHP